MMKTSFFLSIVFMVTLSSCTKQSDSNQAIYLDANRPVEERVEDLLPRMTLEEKVGQMNQFVGLEHMKANSQTMNAEELSNNTANAFYPGVEEKDVIEWIKQGYIGSFLHVLTLEEANRIQHYAMDSRLKIPVIFGIDAIHGNANAPDNTVYPTNIGLACSFDTLMCYHIARETAKEMRAMNMHWTFNPNVEVARDPRWGRVGETFGEDPFLVSQMGVAAVKGYQGSLSTGEDVLACAKHLIAGSESVNGTNGAPADISERTLRELFMPPFKACVDAGVGSFMTAHNELNGIPCHSNEWLMEDVLRKEWGFQGFVVSDWMDIEHLYDLHHTASSIKDAFYQTIQAGMDMHMHGVKWLELVTQLVREGKISEKRIDESVRRILKIKFQLGLFEHPYADASKSMEIRLCDEHRKTALEASRQSIVLLKNNGLLPLSKEGYKHVLVTGINADDQNILGDWSAPQNPDNVTTVLEGLRSHCPNVNYQFVDQGWDPRNMDQKQVDKAVQVAKKCDLNIVVAGEYMMRFRWKDRTCGEDTDRSDIQLVGLQNQLIERLVATGKPTVVILVNGRPLGTEWIASHVDALIEAWEPGMRGGTAIAEILYGDVNPSAKLAVTIPRSVGQQLMVYNHKPSMYFHPYTLHPSTPLYSFGFGLSYTTYAYKNFRMDKKELQTVEPVHVSVDVTNTGKRSGVEIVQLYIRDMYSSVSRPVKELKGFYRVALNPGETKTVQFTVEPKDLAFYNKKMEYVVEPGEFQIMVGSSSQDKDLLVESLTIDSETLISK